MINVTYPFQNKNISKNKIIKFIYKINIVNNQRNSVKLYKNLRSY